MFTTTFYHHGHDCFLGLVQVPLLVGGHTWQVTQTFTPKGSGLLISLPGLGCSRSPLILTSSSQGGVNTKRPQGSPVCRHTLVPSLVGQHSGSPGGQHQSPQMHRVSLLGLISPKAVYSRIPSLERRWSSLKAFNLLDEGHEAK